MCVSLFWRGFLRLFGAVMFHGFLLGEGRCFVDRLGLGVQVIKRRRQTLFADWEGLLLQLLGVGPGERPLPEDGGHCFLGGLFDLEAHQSRAAQPAVAVEKVAERG